MGRETEGKKEAGRAIEREREALQYRFFSYLLLASLGLCCRTKGSLLPLPSCGGLYSPAVVVGLFSPAAGGVLSSCGGGLFSATVGAGSTPRLRWGGSTPWLRGALLPDYGVQASGCGVLLWSLSSRAPASVVTECRLQLPCGMWTPPGPGMEPGSLRWQADSDPLCCWGRPVKLFCTSPLSR